MTARKIVLPALACLFTLCSCKSIRSIGAKDHSASKPAARKKAPAGDPKFLEGITVKPEPVKGARHTTGSASGASATKVVYRPDAGDARLAAFDMEKVDFLQLKYAIMLDASVEKLNNLQLLRNIEKWWGTKYCLGGSTENCIDCSAFTQVMMKEVYGVDLPRTAQQQFNSSERVEMEDLKEGDLVFFHTSGREISHVGIYLLNNKFVHAATSGGVMVSDLNDNYWKPRYRGAGRMK